jgi:two-component system, NarL family, response regulator
MKVRLLIADDHHIVRMGLKTVLKMEPDLEVIAEASTAEQAVAAWLQHRPDVTLMDLRMPGGGHSALAAIRKAAPAARIIILTTSETEQDIHQALSLGASGYCLKHIAPEELAEAIRAVHGGGTWIPDAISRTLAARQGTAELTPREIEVLQLMTKGLTNPDICGTLTISLGTVKAHIRNILAKLEVADRTEAATEALRRGLLD